MDARRGRDDGRASRSDPPGRLTDRGRLFYHPYTSSSAVLGSAPPGAVIPAMNPVVSRQQPVGTEIAGTDASSPPRPRPLDGVRVLDLTRLVAGGLTGMVLADFGADVVKVEQPGVGDPLRQWTTEGEPFWWRVYGRNKRFITLNLKVPEGRELLRRLLPRFDVMLESFIPGTLERLGLGWDVLRTWHNDLILARISGWGQTGPARERPGFGTLVEAASLCRDERRARSPAPTAEFPRR